MLLFKMVEWCGTEGAGASGILGAIGVALNSEFVVGLGDGTTGEDLQDCGLRSGEIREVASADFPGLFIGLYKVYFVGDG